MSARLAARWLAVAAILVVLAVVQPGEAARGWRVAFLTMGAPALGAVPMLAIGRLTDARWEPFGRLAGAAPVMIGAAVVLGVAQIAAPLPPHLAIWGHPLAVGARAVAAVALLALAGARLAAGGSTSFAGATIALYAALITPVAMDWLMGGDNVHTVSSAGMMLAVEQIGGACAALLALGWGGERLRQDVAKLLVAAALGLGYLAFMDYLIVWYGDLPARAGWYVARGTPATSVLAGAALVVGLGGAIAAPALLPGERGRRTAGLSGLAGLLLFNLWWIGGGMPALLMALGALSLLAGICLAFVGQRSPAHG